MPRFDYVALTAQGQEVQGTLEANDLATLRETLRARSLLPVRVDLEGAGGRQASLAQVLTWLDPLRYLPVSSRDKQFLFRQLALMVRAGHRLRAALEMLRTVTRKERLAASLTRMIDRLDRGEGFAEALAAEGKIYPRHVPALIAAGERSGTLERILDEVASSMERARVLRNTLVRALTMPTITLFVAFAVLSFVVIWLVPRLTGFLAANGGEIHWSMQMLVNANAFMLDYGKQIAIGIGATVFVLIAAYATPGGRLKLDRVLLALPIFGRTAILFEMARFGSIGTLLIGAGLRQVETLKVLGQVTQNMAMRAHFERAGDLLLAGHAMREALQAPFFDTLARHMIGVGESSGSLDEVLDHIGHYFTNEVETRIQVLFSTLVPAVTIIVGVVVAIIYLSVILTILGAVNSVR